MLINSPVFVTVLYTAIVWVSFHFILTAIKRSKLNPKRQPPGPFPLPVIGSIFSLGNEPLKALPDLVNKYGSVLSFRLGWQTTVVVTSVSMAKEILLTKDVYFSNRYVSDALTALDHHKYSLGLRPVDEGWKTYRKICINHVFASNRLDATLPLRKQKIQDLISYIQTNSKTGTPVNIGQAVFTTSLNFLSNTIFSFDLGDPNSEIAREFKLLFENLLVEAAVPNIVDYYPFLKSLDPQRIRKRTTAVFQKIMTLFDNIINQRLEEMKSSGYNKKNDVLDTLLTLALDETNDLQLPRIRHLLLDLFGAGTDTTSTTLEWAMTELIHNPQKMKTLQTELQNTIGKHNPLDEQDATKLPYLQAVMKETLRLHPPVPFLLPRTVNNDTPLGNFTIPKNAQILLNINVIHKDPTLWDNPETFDPDRFLGRSGSIDFKGQNFELLPFGSGRRICPGIPLAIKMFDWMLGSLVHSFDWKVQDGGDRDHNTLDMEEKLGFSRHKANPLFAIPITKS